jgi:hypothetical protein
MIMWRACGVDVTRASNPVLSSPALQGALVAVLNPVSPTADSGASSS